MRTKSEASERRNTTEEKPAQAKKRIPLAKRRVSVLRAARKVFSEYGYGGTSMRMIAAEAEINESMLYRICDNKELLFHEAVAAPLEAAVAELTRKSQEIADNNPDTENMRELSEEFFVNLLETMREIAPLLNAALLIGKGSGSTFFKQRLEPALSQLADVIKNNLDNWPHRDFDVELLSRIIFGASWYLAIDERFSGRPDHDVARNAQQIVSMFFQGLEQTN